MEFPEIRWLRITGGISVEPVTTRIPADPEPFIYLIMGPTGSGKSSFIEALAGESQRLSISRDQLAGYTQMVQAYRLLNVHFGNHPIYVVDTPGFSDSRISEIEIFNMIRKWLKDNDLKTVHRILFLTPITETRLPSSRRRTMETVTKFLAPCDGFSAVKVVTTMWDTLHNERTRRRAESNFAELKHQVCGAFIGDHSDAIFRFMNTKRSALQAIDSFYLFSLAFSAQMSSPSHDLYQDLHERIEGALQEMHMIQCELTHPEAQYNAEFIAIIERNQRENQETLAKFIIQFINIGPLPPGSGHAAQGLRKSIAANVQPQNLKQKLLFWQWAHEAEFSHDTEAELEPSNELSLKVLLRLFFQYSKRRGELHIAQED